MEITIQEKCPVCGNKNTCLLNLVLKLKLRKTCECCHGFRYICEKIEIPDYTFEQVFARMSMARNMILAGISVEVKK